MVPSGTHFPSHKHQHSDFTSLAKHVTNPCDT
jgi:hypothetical protein